VTAVLLREKDLSRAELVALGRRIAPLCRAKDAVFLVSHDVDAAVELAADGVHLGFRSVPVAAARAMVGEDALVGKSTHDADELRRAALDGADYVTFGPVFDVPSKKDLLAPRGTTGLASAVAYVTPTPVLALGGVTAANAGELRAAGAAGVACIREILTAQDEAAAARRLVASWRGGR